MAKVAVIGAGLGGLSAAIRLAHAGYDVDVYDKQDFAGGKAGSNSTGGYRFDTGPSLLTLPGVFRELFLEVGESMDDYLVFDPLDPLCTYFYPDGTHLKSYHDLDRFGEEIEKNTSDSVHTLKNYMEYTKGIYDLTEHLFLRKSLSEMDTYTSWKSFYSILNLPRIGALSSLDGINRRYFRDPKMVQLFNRYATYNGSTPFRAPGTFGIIPYIEYTFGGYSVRGGIYAIPEAFKRLAVNLGVRFHLSCEVSRILTEGRKVKGIEVQGEKLPYDVVVSNADVIATYKSLLDDSESPWIRRYERLELSSSGMVFFLGMGKQFQQLSVHNILFSSDYHREFDQIFRLRQVPSEPTVYINITSKTETGDAPSHGENWFVLINVPNDRGQEWKREADNLRRSVFEKIEHALGTDPEQFIEYEEIMTPREIENRTSSTHGSLYGLSSNSRLSAFLRHPNRSKQYRGLYFCGGSAHPGGGMPLVVLSGKITSDLVKKYEPVHSKIVSVPV